MSRQELTISSQEKRPTWPELSRRLHWLLVSARDVEKPVNIILASPDLVRETIHNLDSLRELATDPAGREGVCEIISRRFALYPQPERSEGEWALWWADYLEALEAVPYVVLEQAMQAHIRGERCQFLPKPGELLAQMKFIVSSELVAYARAKAVADAPSATVHKVPEDPATRAALIEASRAAVRKMAKDFLDQCKAREVAREAARPKLQPAFVYTDEGGLTPQMRASIMARHGQPYPFGKWSEEDHKMTMARRDPLTAWEL